MSLRAWSSGVAGNMNYEENYKIHDLYNFLNINPVILQTYKMGGLKGGHIILAIGYQNENIICHDPFGNALSKYTDHNGMAVHYPVNFLKPYLMKKARLMYWTSTDTQKKINL